MSFLYCKKNKKINQIIINEKTDKVYLKNSVGKKIKISEQVKLGLTYYKNSQNIMLYHNFKLPKLWLGTLPIFI